MVEIAVQFTAEQAVQREALHHRLAPVRKLDGWIRLGLEVLQ